MPTSDGKTLIPKGVEEEWRFFFRPFSLRGKCTFLRQTLQNRWLVGISSQ